ncbi:MAG: hypothetical protein IIC91_08600 [Chloroflexi bacterium]|nr:hypothetical protein [Chloroflexota bacterium]
MPFSIAPIIVFAMVLLWLGRRVHRTLNPHGRERAQLRKAFKPSWAAHLSDCDHCFEASSPLLTHAEAVANATEATLLGDGVITRTGLMEPIQLVDYVERAEKQTRLMGKATSAAALLAVVALVVVPVTLGVVLSGGQDDTELDGGTGQEIEDIVYQVGIQEDYCDAAFRGWTPSFQQEISNIFEGDDLDPFGVDDAKNPYYECLDADYPPWDHGY